MQVSGFQAIDRLATGQLLVVPIGVPGSGKTTLANLLVEKGLIEGLDVVGTDVLRAESLYRSEVAVFEAAYDMVRRRLEAGKSVYFDATNLLPSRRARLSELASEVGAAQLAIVMDTPLDLALERRRRTGTDVPAAVLEELVGLSRGLIGEDLECDWVRSNQLISVVMPL